MSELSHDGHFVVLLDLLGFSRMVETESLDQVCARVENVLLDECEHWASARPAGDFDTIYFSDTVLIFARRPGCYREWYDDLRYIGSRVCSRLLADRIPIRGAMAYGSFTVRAAGRHQVFAGRALVEAHQREQRLQALGFIVAPNIFRHFFRNEKRGAFSRDRGDGVELEDGSLWVNFMTQFHGDRKFEVLAELEHRWGCRSCNGLDWLDTEVLAFAFITEEARQRSAAAPAGDRVASKYIKAAQLLREVLGEDLHAFARGLVDAVRSEAQNIPK